MYILNERGEKDDNCKKIKAVFADKIQANSEWTVSELQELVKENVLLTSADWDVYTHTRKTNYKKWHHKIQGVLFEYKSKGLVKHDKLKHSYTF